jgi:hypothetical protein
MTTTLQFLNLLAEHQLAKGHLRGVLHLAIGRTVVRTSDNVVLCAGVTWRELAILLKESKFDRELARDLGADPDTLHPRDREKFWYSVIGLARVDSIAAREEADKLAKKLTAHGLTVLAPGGSASKLSELAPAQPNNEAAIEEAAKPKKSARPK